MRVIAILLSREGTHLLFLSFPFTVWVMEMIAGAPEGVLDHEDESYTLGPGRSLDSHIVQSLLYTIKLILSNGNVEQQHKHIR